MGAKLSARAVDAIIAKAIETDLVEPERRRLLLARLPAGVRASLPRLSRPDDQLRSDVLRLNELGLIEVWLREAQILSHAFEPAGASLGQAGVSASSNATPGAQQAATEHWAALIVDDSDTQWRGSGVVIGPRHVLTAEHVVSGVEQCRVRLQTDEPGRPARVAWRNPDLDVALLLTHDTLDERASIQARCRGGFIAADVHWQCYGYPGLYATKPSETLQQEGGRTLFWAVGSQLPLALTIQGGPKGERALNGLSGAGVLIDGRVVAIITAFEKARQQDRIDAVPLARFFNEPGFRAAVGLRAGAEADERWQRLRASMLRVIEIGIIRKAIVAQLGVALDGAEAVLNELLQRPAVDVVRMLNVVIADLTWRAPQHAADLRLLLLALVPWLADLRTLRISQQEALLSGECCFDVPCRNGLLIEALMAGMHPRAMAPPDALHAGDGGPQLKLSSITYAPVADADGSGAVDCVVREIAWLEGIDEAGKTPPQLLDAVLNHLKRVLEDPADPLDPLDLAEEVEDLLQYATERPENAFHYYLLFDAQDADAMLASNRQALRQALPGLWLVRSTSRHQAERRMVRHLKDAAAAIQKAMPSDD